VHTAAGQQQVLRSVDRVSIRLWNERASGNDPTC
jgi:hypothetical protein